MNRATLLTGHVEKHQRGIEIGPWCHPLLPKREGFNVTILDVFPTEELRRRALDDPDLPDACAAVIEKVDLVGSACDIGELVTQQGTPECYDYIVASHAFEHLPDPVRFLQGCERTLRLGGVVSMAIPDKRGCFDYYRPVSSLAEMVAAYFEQRRQPTLAQVFERWSLHARWRHPDGKEQISFPPEAPPAEIEPFDSLAQAFAEWEAMRLADKPPYQDTHCWVFTPALFRLILFDLNALGLTSLQCQLCQPCGSEFVVHLARPTGTPNVLNEAERLARRKALLLATLQETTPRLAARNDPERTGPMRWLTILRVFFHRKLRTRSPRQGTA